MFGKVQKYLRLKNKFLSIKPIWCCETLRALDNKELPEAYNIFGSNGILFNHESPRRGETFVTKKIIKALVRIKMGHQKQLVLGNGTPETGGTQEIT